MAKIHLVMKTTYADFDIPINTPVLASKSKELINSKVDEFNAKRSKDDLREEIKYDSAWVKLI